MSNSGANIWGFTHVNIKKSSYLWSIKNYSYIYVERGEKLESPIFSLDSNDDGKYCIAVWPSGSTGAIEDYISMSFCNKSSRVIDVEFCISILNTEGKKFNEIKKRCSITSNNYNGFNGFIKKSLLHETNGLIVNDVITFFCEYAIFNSPVNSTVSMCPSPRLLKTKALDAFEQHLDVEEFSDFTIIAPCGKKLFVHKFILAARSPVFSAMFKNTMKEKIHKSVNIEDVNYDVLKEMLRFMYAAKVENLDKIAYELVAAADKYQVDGLKELCEEYFFKNINPNNVKEIMDLTHCYKLENLKDHIHRYVVCHSKTLFDTIGFESNENMKILTETFYKLKMNKM